MLLVLVPGRVVLGCACFKGAGRRQIGTEHAVKAEGAARDASLCRRQGGNLQLKKLATHFVAGGSDHLQLAGVCVQIEQLLKAA